MAAQRHTIKWSKNVGGGGAIYMDFPEADSQTYLKGTPLIFDISESGVSEVTTSSGPMSAATLLGIATEDAVNNTSNALVSVLIPRVSDIFEASVSSSEDAVAAPKEADLGESYNLQLLTSTGGAGGEYTVDNGDETTVVVKVVGYHPQDLEFRGGLVASLAAGDRVLFQFISSALDTGSRA